MMASQNGDKAMDELVYADWITDAAFQALSRLRDEDPKGYKAIMRCFVRCHRAYERKVDDSVRLLVEREGM